MAFFFLKYLFSFQRYWHFSIMQISSVMTSFGLQLKLVKYSIKNISKTIEAVFLILGTTDVHHKRNKMTPLKLLPWQQFCRWCCLNKNWNSQFVLNLHHLPQPIRWFELIQYGNYACSKQDPLSHFRGCRWGHLFFMRERETGAERVAMAIKLRVSFCSFCDAHLWCQVSKTLL